MSPATNHLSKYVFYAFSATVVAISALTSFAFFATFLPSLVPAILTSENGGTLISGAVGVLLLDVACLVWLRVGQHAETSQQSAIAGIGAALTFIGSAVASVAHLALNASEVTLSFQMQDAVSMGALLTVIAAVVLNFLLSILFSSNSAQAQKRRRETSRMQSVNEATNTQATELNKMVAAKVITELEKKAPELASRTARQHATDFLRGEERANGNR